MRFLETEVQLAAVASLLAGGTRCVVIVDITTVSKKTTNDALRTRLLERHGKWKSHGSCSGERMLWTEDG